MGRKFFTITYPADHPFAKAMRAQMEFISEQAKNYFDKMETEKITDESVMAFGQYKGQKLANVPAYYLIFLHDAGRAGRYKNYIWENLENLHKEAKKDKRFKKLRS